MGHGEQKGDPMQAKGQVHASCEQSSILPLFRKELCRCLDLRTKEQFCLRCSKSKETLT